ncbi:hypothetical protein FCIRC_8415 [Fusarium circinatum]|uniref:Uncharacterized protein n=1 Tax=Fusarium circinatum TaxID=48490 RepID=A0A8H5WR54_FUSCI|nr:hypothetical protein FCIRC_8415 [Fusarium circinatum]
MTCPLATFVLVQVFSVECEAYLQCRQYWHRSTIPVHDIFSLITPLLYLLPLNVRADLWYTRDKTPGTGGQRVYCPFCYFAFFASVLRLKTLLSSRPYHTYLMDWTIPFCRMKSPTSSLGSEPIYPAPLPTPPIPLTAQVCTSSNSRPTRKDHGNHNSPSWVFLTGHPYCPTSSLSYELHIIDTSDIASTLTEHPSGDGEPLDQPTLETRSQEDREGGLQQEAELRVTCNLIEFVVVILTLVICALLMAAARQNVNQDSLVAPADMRQDNDQSNLQSNLVAPLNVVIQLDSTTQPPCRCTPQHQPLYCENGNYSYALAHPHRLE